MKLLAHNPAPSLTWLEIVILQAIFPAIVRHARMEFAIVASGAMNDFIEAILCDSSRASCLAQFEYMMADAKARQREHRAERMLREFWAARNKLEAAHARD